MTDAVNGDYVRAVTERARVAAEEGYITAEEGRAMVKEAIMFGRPAEVVAAAPAVTADFRAMKLPSGVPLTYDTIREFAWDYINQRAREKDLDIAYGVKTVGGLNRLRSFMCGTAYRLCKVIQPNETVRAAVIERCSDITNQIKRIKATDPSDVELPTDMATTLTAVERRIMDRSETANKKVYVLDGRLKWIDALIKSGDYVGYRSVEELKGEKTNLSAMFDTTGNYYRLMEPFLQYIETNRIDLRSFGSMELRDYGDMYRADDFAAKQDKYAKKKEYYATHQKEYHRDIGLNMSRYNRDRKTAMKLMPAKPNPLARNTIVDILNITPQFFTWLVIAGNFPPGADGVVKNPLKNVHVSREPSEIIPYRLQISDRKVLLTDSDEILSIYRSILNAPLKEQYKRGIFILLRIIRESGARPANVVWLRWENFPKTEPRRIDWKYAGSKKVIGKEAPKTTYISRHLASDIDTYIRKYKPDPKEHVAGSSIFNRHDLELDKESGYLTLDKDILATHITRLGKFTGGIPVSSLKLRKSLASLVWACLENTPLVEEITGDQASTVKAHYVEADYKYIQLPENILGKYTPAEIARKVFDDEYPATGIPTKYLK